LCAKIEMNDLVLLLLFRSYFWVQNEIEIEIEIVIMGAIISERKEKNFKF